MEILLYLTRYALVAAVLVFVLIVVTTYWPGRRGRFDQDANIPLRDDK